MIITQEITDFLAYMVFLIAIATTLYFRDKARSSRIITGKKIRSIYRKAWVESTLKRDAPANFIETVRNNIIVSTTLLSAIVVSFGFVINSHSVKIDTDLISIVRLISIIALLGYSLFMTLLEVRSLAYIPIIAGVPENLIKKYENDDKASYIAKLLHESFDNFSDSVRALLYLAPLLLWFYNVYLFIFVTMIIAFVMYREDFGKKSGITIF